MRMGPGGVAIQHASGRHHETIPCFARSLLHRPGNLRVLQGLGWSQLQAGHQQMAP